MTSEPKHIIRTDGTQTWYVNGQRHRTDGPARIWADGGQVWYINGQRHRLDGPAIICPDGGQAWFVNGQRHRTDGPACIYADGYQAWFVNGENITAQVLIWMEQQSVTWPWDQATQAQFILTFA